MTKELQKRIMLFAILGSLLLLGLFTVIFPSPEFSFHERRYLASAPENFSLTDWTLKDDLENYLSERMPLRTAFIGVNSLYDTILAQRTRMDVWAVKGMLLEKPLNMKTDTLARRMDAIAAAAKAKSIPYQIMVVPSAGAVMQDEMPVHLGRLYEGEAEAQLILENREDVIPLHSLMDSDVEQTYFRTDHHWTLGGAYLAYEAYCQRMGFVPLTLNSFALSDHPGFRGSTYARSGHFSWEGDIIHCAQPQNEITFRILDKEEIKYDSLIFPEEMDSWDPYTMFLKGNHGLAVIENDKASQGHLLVFKDSFANTLLPLLSAHYQKITLVDFRYYAGDFQAAVAAAEDADSILFCYSLDSVLNDTSIARKLK